MINYLFFFSFFLSIFFPLCAVKTNEKKQPADYGAKHHFVACMDNKETILACAKQARKCANGHLERAEELLSEIKTVNWRIRDRLSILVSSYMGSAFIQDPKTKFLGVALALLTDLIVKEGFDKAEITYELYWHLVYASTSLEQANYYNRLSKKAKMSKHIENKSWELVNRALDYLTEADMLTTVIEFGKTNMVLSDHITTIRDRIINNMVDERNILRNYKGEIEICLENFGEIVEEAKPENREILEIIRKRLKVAAKLINSAIKEADDMDSGFDNWILDDLLDRDE